MLYVVMLILSVLILAGFVITYWMRKGKKKNLMMLVLIIGLSAGMHFEGKAAPMDTLEAATSSNASRVELQQKEGIKHIDSGICAKYRCGKYPQARKDLPI